MDIILAIIQLLFTYINDNLDQMDNLRSRRDIDDPVIIVPEEPMVQSPEVVIPEKEIFVPVTHEENANPDTPGFFTFTKATTEDPAKGIDINLYSEPFCANGFMPLPGLVKDIFLTFSLLVHFVQLLNMMRKAAVNRRRRLAAAANHPINRPILGQLGK